MRMATACDTQKHAIRWFVYTDEGLIPRTHVMRETWGYDVKCSCGWETRTGGAVKRYMNELIWEHKNGFRP